MSSHPLARPTTDISTCACLTLPGIHSENTKKDRAGGEEKWVFFCFLLPSDTVPAELQKSMARDQPQKDAGVARELPCSQLAKQLCCDICTPLAPQEQGLTRMHRGTPWEGHFPHSIPRQHCHPARATCQTLVGTPQ